MDVPKTSRRDQRWSLESRREPKAARAAAGRPRRESVPLDEHADLAVPDDRASALAILQT